MAGLEEPSSLKELVPVALQGRRIDSADVKLLAQQHSSGQRTKYSLLLIWTEDDRDQQQQQPAEQQEQSNKSSRSTRRQRSSSSTSSCARDPLRGHLTCDGPCREKRSPREVHSMGRCDHYICNFCYKINNNPDGSIGCTAFDCMRVGVYGHLSDRDAWEAYQSDIVGTYQARKSRHDNGDFQFEKRYRSVSNPPSNRATKKNSFVNSQELVAKLQECELKPIASQSTDSRSSSCSKVAVRTMVYHVKNGRSDRTLLAYSLSQETDLKTAIKYAMRMVLGSKFKGSVRASIGTAENQVVFRPLDPEGLQKTLNDYTGSNGKVNLVVDTLEKMEL